MTRISKPLTREVHLRHGPTDQPFVVTLDEKVLRIRIKGRRESYPIRYDTIFLEAVRQKVQA